MNTKEENKRLNEVIHRLMHEKSLEILEKVGKEPLTTQDMILFALFDQHSKITGSSIVKSSKLGHTKAHEIEP